MTPEQQKIKELEAQLKQMQESHKKLLRQAKRAEQESVQARKTIQDLRMELIVWNANAEDNARVVIECLMVLREKFPNDAEFQKEVWERILVDSQDSSRNRGREKFFQRMYEKCSEKLHYPTMDEKLKTAQTCINMLKPEQRSTKERAKKMGNAIAAATKAVSKKHAETGDEKYAAADRLAKHVDPAADRTQEPQDSPGRQSLPYDANNEEPASIELKCSCGNHHDFTEGALKQSALRTAESSLLELVKTVASRYQQVQCNKCGRVHLVYHDGDMPVTPQSTMGISSVVASAVMHADGIPLNKVEKRLFGPKSDLGHSTLGSNVHTLCKETLEPMVDAFKKTMNTQNTLIADETVLKVLQSQGKGSCESAQKTRQQDYLAAVCSPFYEGKRCVVFSHLGGRGNEAIQANLDQYAPKAWVTDAYAAYDSYCADKKDVKHQCCLVHLKRELLDAVDIDKLTKKLNCSTLEEAVAKACQDIDKNNAVYLMCCVIRGISLIFGHEKQVKPDPTKPIEEYFDAVKQNREEHAKVLMADIDKVMAALAVEYTQQKGGKYVAKSRNNQMCKAVTYYMNHRENFKTFVDDPKIPLDSNAVESSIRAVAVLRKACDFKQSVEYTESLCTLLSVTETAKANGVTNPMEWLTDYAKAYYLHRASNTLTRLVNEEGRSLDSKLMEFDKGSEVGFDIEPWLPWNYVKR